MRLDDAEFVPLGIGENDMALVFPLTDVHMACTRPNHSGDEILLVLDRCRGQIEMDVVLSGLRVLCRLEDDDEASVVDWDQRGIAIGFTDLPAQRLGPELRHELRIVGIEAQGDDA